MKLFLISITLLIFLLINYTESFSQEKDSIKFINISNNVTIDSSTYKILSDLEDNYNTNNYIAYCNRIKNLLNLYNHSNEIKIPLEIFTKSSILNLWRKPKTIDEKLITREYELIKGYFFDVKIGDYNNSQKAYENALIVDRQINDERYHWWIHNPLANIYNRLGDYKKSITLFKECETVLIKSKENSKLMRMYVNMAKVYKELNNIEDAKALCIKVSNSPHSNLKGQVNSLLFLSSLYYEENNFSDAIEIQKKLEIVLHKMRKEINSDPDLSYYNYRVAEFYNLKSQIKYRDNVDESLEYFNKSISYLNKSFNTRSRREFGKYYNSYNRLQLSSENSTSSINYSNLALRSVIPKYDITKLTPPDSLLYPENTIQEALTLKGKAYELKYQKSKDITDLKSANQCYNSALKVAQLLRKEYVFDDSKYVALQDNKELIEASLNNYNKLSQIDTVNNYFDQILDLFLDSKSNVLAEKRNYTYALKQMTPAQKRDYEALNAKLDSLPTDSNTSTEYINYLDAKKEFLDNLVGAYNLSKEVGSNYIDYFVGDDNTFALVNTNEIKELFLLGTSEDLANKINVYKNLLHNSHNEYEKFNTIQNQLYEFLIKPLGQLPEKIKIIPDENLASISFENLIDDEGKFLLENYTISYHYVATENKSLDKNKTTKSMIFSPKYKENKNPSLALFRDNLYEIPFAKKEAQAINNILNSNLYIESDANKSNFLSQIRECNILHFAGHAVLDSLNNAFLAFSSIEEKENQLSLSELDTFYLDIDMLTLSACNTASGKIQPGEGTFSLARSFHGIGAESIISTLWEISDQTSSEIMIAFYKNLKNGQAKDEALRNAKLEYIKNADPDYQHPYYWAGIIAIGDMSPLFPKSNYKYYWIFSCSILVLTIGLFYKQKQRESNAA